MNIFRQNLLCVATAGMVLVLARDAWGQVPEQILKSFGQAGESSSNPVGLLAGSDGVLYGTTTSGGINSAGTVFKVNPDGTGYTLLHAFTTNGVDGQQPEAGLVLGQDGMLYGTTAGGGSNQLGTVFKLAPDGSSYAVIHTFGGYPNDGDSPEAKLLVGADGALYGTTHSGGTNNTGTVFKLNTSGHGYSILHNFGDVTTDGSYPKAVLIQGVDGVLYGTTYGLQSVYGGTVFKLGTNGAGYAQLHAFGIGTDGAQPTGLVQGEDGTLFGTTEWGGTNYDQYGISYGTIFKVKTNGLGYAMLHGFNGELGDGANPQAGLILGTDGGLYGTTYAGGSLQDDGVVFRINADGSDYQVLRRFTVITSIISDYSSDGQGPGPLVQAADGTLFGITLYGGTTGQGGYQYTGAGTIFALATNSASYSVIYNFSATGGDGANPPAGLLLGNDGAFYGTTASGGLGDAGTIFKVNANGSGYQIVYNFGLGPIDGVAPESALIQGQDGMLYGTTSEGGYGNGGMVFKVNPDGSGFTLLHSFGFGSIQNDGQAPVSPLLQGQDGELYGTTAGGGYYSDYGDYGTVFKLNTNGTDYAIIYYFNTNDLDGQSPQAGLIQGKDGALYGTTYGGISYDGSRYTYGTVFKLLTNGAGFQVLHTFTKNGVDGAHSYAALVQDADGTLYGTTQYGGSNNLNYGSFSGSGTIFKVNDNGSDYQIFHQFGSSSTDGQNPSASLILGSDGALYGTTMAGGANTDQFGNGYGTAFKLNIDGTSYQVLYSFGAHQGNTQYAPDGITPHAGLVQGADGAFYGTTTSGGDMNLGTVFRLGFPPFEFTAFRWLPDKTLSLSISGSSNTTCRIDASTNLLNWVTLTNIVNLSGVVQFQDTLAPNFPRRFYRAFQAP
jgi:uncharacterized repeat protein (TIGR03803 family)